MEEKNIDQNTNIEYYSPSKVIIGESNVHGRGIFATQSIPEGDIVERCPMVPLGFRSRYHTDPQIYRYLYSQPPCPCRECENHGFVFHMILGYGMMYNHQDNANTKWVFDYNNFIGDIVAIKDIEKDTEIFVDYGTKYFNNQPKIDLDNAKDPE